MRRGRIAHQCFIKNLPPFHTSWLYIHLRCKDTSKKPPTKVFSSKNDTQSPYIPSALRRQEEVYLPYHRRPWFGQVVRRICFYRTADLRTRCRQNRTSDTLHPLHDGIGRHLRYPRNVREDRDRRHREVFQCHQDGHCQPSDRFPNHVPRH